ncbi:MAG: hypothetical protein COU85_00620 [Candidatus Portnoybacteria bacterium CG10_big_fil_rev_8_21_14_0_10_44_7]|uniref:Uncharacterized protein n=1 Tax=Candidatus Portnoybacteria bacterium CG10_big_fil_rev_8_21_14_0_10_44_7 TaxID=1974816 RepID=A0A2M8KJ95_9BACT|nr:MAG: hypothetical protein COU85_00620 [Candidatus Portnoybacteria bacterium CG10_big_fil_rev_8_21_14_0_10_44_7]
MGCARGVGAFCRDKKGRGPGRAEAQPGPSLGIRPVSPADTCGVGRGRGSLLPLTALKFKLF